MKTLLWKWDNSQATNAFVPLQNLTLEAITLLRLRNLLHSMIVTATVTVNMVGDLIINQVVKTKTYNYGYKT